MMTAETLLLQCQKLGVRLAHSPEGKLQVSPPGKLPDDLRAELKRCKAEVLALLRNSSPSQPENSRTIYEELVNATPKADALLVFPDWQGLLIKSSVLEMSVWVVRNHIDGIALAKDTGHPALVLDDVLRLKGKTAEEARAALLPELITVMQ